MTAALFFFLDIVASPIPVVSGGGSGACRGVTAMSGGAGDVRSGRGGVRIVLAWVGMGAVLRGPGRGKEVVVVSGLGRGGGGNRRLVLALKTGWSIRKRWRSSWRKATGLSSSPSPP